MKHCFFSIFFIFVLALYGCSVENNPGPITAQPLTSAPERIANVIPTPTAGKVPITWAGLNLTGRLVYIAADSTFTTGDIQSLDLATGELQTLFQYPVGAWSDAVVASPDNKTLILAYLPPKGGVPYGGQESLYELPLDVSEPPQLLFTSPASDDGYSQPQWSPDGKYIYLVHIKYQTVATYEVMRMIYPNGKLEKLIDHAYWPRVSFDGKQLVFVSIDPDTGANKLFLANADGSDAHQIQVGDLPVQIIDVPMISPDNQSILFSSPDGLSTSMPNWIDKLLGVQVALADGSLPSDWWSVPISGGKAKQLTRIQSLALYGVYSPDRKFIASYSANGIFVMRPDGTELTMVVSDVGGIVGTVSWIP